VLDRKSYVKSRRNLAASGSLRRYHQRRKFGKTIDEKLGANMADRN
jgi:hypothetical protein